MPLQSFSTVRESVFCLLQTASILEAANRPPIGLNLKKSPSALDWFQTQLDQQRLQQLDLPSCSGEHSPQPSSCKLLAAHTAIVHRNLVL